MRFLIQAACCCHTGRVRRKNEDNFFFDGKCLEQENDGLSQPISLEGVLKNGSCLAVFDGMGGENFGEMASFAAAGKLRELQCDLDGYAIPATEYISSIVQTLNEAVLESQKQMLTDKMGTTMVGLVFDDGDVYVCNVGDSRAYRFRDEELLQISVDHTEKRPVSAGRKPALIQYLGMDTEEFAIEPHIAKEELRQGDSYLLCSDGLSDMLTNMEITDIMRNGGDAKNCARQLLDAALAHGGRDNITIIVCKLIQRGNVYVGGFWKKFMARLGNGRPNRKG